MTAWIECAGIGSAKRYGIPLGGWLGVSRLTMEWICLAISGCAFKREFRQADPAAGALAQIEQYITTRVRDTLSMVVYQLQVHQVDLPDTSQQGVDWTRLGASSLNRTKPISATTPSTGADLASAASDLAKAFALMQSGSDLGAVFRGPTFDIDALITFLKTQATVKTVSQQRLAMLTGSKGMLRVGQSTTFVSKVSSSQTGVSQVTVETRDLRTSLELSLVGEESDRTIYTRVSLSLSELLRLRKYTTLGTELNLPEVADRDLQTSIRLPAAGRLLRPAERHHRRPVDQRPRDWCHHQHGRQRCLAKRTGHRAQADVDPVQQQYPRRGNCPIGGTL
jgi:hypothetical protein